jgi:HK97 family phage prohead protease
MRKLEYRENFHGIRATDDTGDDLIAGRVAGYSSTFWAVDSYYTAMAPGAFQKSLSERADRITILYNHDPNENIGIPEVQVEDEKGLRLEADIANDHGTGTTTMRRLKAGVRYGFSFGFETLQDRSATDDDPLDFAQKPNVNRSEIRVITEVKLWEHSIVTFSANERAEIEQVRQQFHAEALGILLDDLRENRLTDDERRLVAEIVAAFPVSPDANGAPGAERKTRRLEAEIALANLRYLTADVARNTA